MSMSSVKPTLLFILVYMTQLVDASVCFGQYGVSFPFLSFFTQTLSIRVSNINLSCQCCYCQNIASVCLSGPFYRVCFLFFCTFRISHCPFLAQPPLPIPQLLSLIAPYVNLGLGILSLVRGTTCAGTSGPQPGCIVVRQCHPAMQATDGTPHGGRVSRTWGYPSLCASSILHTNDPGFCPVYLSHPGI